MVPKILFVSSVFFIMACFVFAFAWYINNSNLTCLAPAAHAALTLTPKTSDLVESVDVMAKRERFSSASVASNYVLAMAVTYGFTLTLTTLYAFLSMCCCPNSWYISKCVRYQFHANFLAGVLCLCLIVATSVHAGLSEGLWNYAAVLTGLGMCADVLWVEVRNWCTAIIFFSFIVLLLHAHVALMAYIFKRDQDALAWKSLGSSTESSNTSDPPPQQQQLPNAEAPLKNDGEKKSKGFTNFLTFKPFQERPRIPSSRNYPSSPILPINGTIDANSKELM